LSNKQIHQASSFWQISSELGHGYSSWNLGIFYLNGFGVDVDIRQGVNLIRKGCSLVDGLDLPPQLEGLQDGDLDELVDIATDMDERGEVVQIDAVVKAVHLGLFRMFTSLLPQVHF
jgi:hypothetical protein